MTENSRANETSTRRLRPFAELSDRGRHRRLRAVAQQALDSYGLGSAQISFVAESFNTVSAPGVPNMRDCMLFDWVPGAVLRKRPTEYRLREAGRGLAVFHEHAASHVHGAVPKGAMVGDRVLYFSDHKRLDELRPRFGSLFDEAMSRAQEHLDVLWKHPPHPPHPPHLLHGDYTWHNILSTGNRLTIIDFQDLLWGFDVQDAMIALFPFDRVNEGVELSAWFRSGYEAVRPWPVNDPDLFAALVAARRYFMPISHATFASRGSTSTSSATRTNYATGWTVARPPSPSQCCAHD